jgi:hypothetical protein
MWKLLISIIFVATIATAQFKFTAAQLAYLNQIYAKSGEGSVPGTWLATNSVPLNRLVVAVLTNETEPAFHLWLGSNAYVRLEQDPIFTNWLATSYVVGSGLAVFTNWLRTSYTNNTLDILLSTNNWQSTRLVTNDVQSGKWLIYTNPVFDSATTAIVTWVTNAYWGRTL